MHCIAWNIMWFVKLKTLKKNCSKTIKKSQSLKIYWLITRGYTPSQLLDVSWNQFTGNIASGPLTNVVSLELLLLSNSQHDLRVLDLSHNKFSGMFHHGGLRTIQDRSNYFQVKNFQLQDHPNMDMTIIDIYRRTTCTVQSHKIFVRSFQIWRP
jgi:hypothetical protein